MDSSFKRVCRLAIEGGVKGVKSFIPGVTNPLSLMAAQVAINMVILWKSQIFHFTREGSCQLPSRYFPLRSKSY